MKKGNTTKYTLFTISIPKPPHFYHRTSKIIQKGLKKGVKAKTPI
jgi:hypothetical protein